MSKRARRSDQTTETQLAERYYERRDDDGEWGEPEPLEKPARLEVTLSVRFTADEINALRAAADKAGIKPTAFIRQAAMAALAHRPVDRARVEQDLKQAVELMRDAQRALAS
jgi:predicted component of type VI protein secretion system